MKTSYQAKVCFLELWTRNPANVCLNIWVNEPHSLNCFIYILWFPIPALEYLKYLPKCIPVEHFYLFSAYGVTLFSQSGRRKKDLKKNSIPVKLRQYELHLRNESEVSPMLMVTWNPTRLPWVVRISQQASLPRVMRTRWLLISATFWWW